MNLNTSFCHLKSRRHRRSMKKSYLLIRLTVIIWMCLCVNLMWHKRLRKLCQTSDLGLLKEIFVLQLGANPSCSFDSCYISTRRNFQKNKNTFDVCVFSNTQGVEFVIFFDLLSYLSLLSLHFTPSIRCLDPHPAATHS